MGGLFTLKDTHGIPLDLAIEHCKDVPALPDWLEYLADAGSQDGHKLQSALREMGWVVKEEAQNEITDKFRQIIGIHPNEPLQSACERILKGKRENGQKWESAMGLK